MFMEKLIKIPKRFLVDCVDCDCEVPEPVKTTTSNFYILSERTEKIAELINRAFFYAFDGVDGCHGIVASAKATLKAIYKANIFTENETKRYLDKVQG
jgi:hypothetical protein